MSREIEFRGMTKQGEWVYGSFINIDSPSVQIMCNNHTSYEVIPSTVGQYTGLLDKNKKKIFEGDLIKVDDAVVTVIFKNGCWIAGHNAEDYLFRWNKYCEIVGDVHESEEE